MKKAIKILFCLMMVVTMFLVACNNGEVKEEKKEVSIECSELGLDTSGGLSFQVGFKVINTKDGFESGAKIKLGHNNQENMADASELLVLDKLDSEGNYRVISNPIDKALYYDYFTILPYVITNDGVLFGDIIYTTIYDLCINTVNSEGYEKDRNIEKVIEAINNYDSYHEFECLMDGAYFSEDFILNVKPYLVIENYSTSASESDSSKLVLSNTKASYANSKAIYLNEVSTNLYEVSNESKYTLVLSYTDACSDKFFNDSLNDNKLNNFRYAYVSDEGINFYDINPTAPSAKFSYKFEELPTPTKEGFEFVSWEKENNIYKGIWIEVVNLNLDEVMKNVSDVLSSFTVDSLPLKDGDTTFEWSCSIEGLYNIDDEGKATVSRVYQTHKVQNATITLKATLNNGSISYATKDVLVEPVTFDDFPSTPIATYFAVGSASAYTSGSPRYKEEKTLFSESTKQTLDILYYAFATTSNTGTISVSGTNYINEVMQLKDYNVRIIISLSGTSTETSRYFAKIGESFEDCQKYASDLMDIVEKYNFDGVDIDWESTYEQYTTAKGYNNLSKAIREEMDKRQDERGTNYLLTAALAGTSWATSSDRLDFKTLNKYLDYINAMTYDSNNEDKSTHLAPMNVSSYDGGYGFGCSYAASRFSQLGFSRNKIILGIAGYGKAYSLSGKVSSSAVYPGLGVAAKLTAIDVTGSFASGTLYGSGIQTLLNDPSYIKYDEYNKAGNFVGSYMYNPNNNIFVTYDSALAVEQKYDYANNTDGMGLMCWSYTEDTYDRVIDTISKKVGNK